MKQANIKEMFREASKSVSISTNVISPDPLSPTSSTSSATKTPENIEDNPDDSEQAGEGDIQMEYSSDQLYSTSIGRSAHLVGVALCHSMSVKYLAVILNSRLTWREHVDVRVKKTHNLLWACGRACGAAWDLRPKVVHWLYVSIIWPSITSASLVWWPSCQTATAKKRLSRIQSVACLGDVH